MILKPWHFLCRLQCKLWWEEGCQGSWEVQETCQALVPLCHHPSLHHLALPPRRMIIWSRWWRMHCGEWELTRVTGVGHQGTKSYFWWGPWSLVDAARLPVTDDVTGKIVASNMPRTYCCLPAKCSILMYHWLGAWSKIACKVVLSWTCSKILTLLQQRIVNIGASTQCHWLESVLSDTNLTGLGIPSCSKVLSTISTGSRFTWPSSSLHLLLLGASFQTITLNDTRECLQEQKSVSKPTEIQVTSQIQEPQQVTLCRAP